MKMDNFISSFEKRAKKTGFSVDKHTKFSLLIGGNVKTSPSFKVFNYILNLGNENIVYLPYEIFSEKELEEMTGLLKDCPRLIQLIISDPFKIMVMKYLDELDESSEKAKSVNNVIRAKDNRLIGLMYDGTAWVYWWKNIIGDSLENKKFIHLGAGGVARAFASATLNETVNVELVFTDILDERLNTLNEIIKQWGENVNAKMIKVESYSESEELNYNLIDADIIINGTGLGKTKGNIYAYPRLDYSRTRGKVCIDWNYRPAAKNIFLKYSEDNGAIIYNALGFLITGFYYTFHSISDKRGMFDYDKILKFAKEKCGFRDTIEADFEGDERLAKAKEKVSNRLLNLNKLSPAQFVKEIKHRLGRPEISIIEEVVVTLDYLFKYDRLFAKDVKNKLRDYFSQTGWKILSDAIEYHLPQLR